MVTEVCQHPGFWSLGSLLIFFTFLTKLPLTPCNPLSSLLPSFLLFPSFFKLISGDFIICNQKEPEVKQRQVWNNYKWEKIVWRSHSRKLQEGLSVIWFKRVFPTGSYQQQMLLWNVCIEEDDNRWRNLTFILRMVHSLHVDSRDPTTKELSWDE